MRKYRIILLIILFLGVNLSLSAQKIEGLWQKDSEIVGSGLGEAYHFLGNGEFEFYVSQYLYLNTIL